MNKFTELLKEEGFIVLDGAMGTMIGALPDGVRPESLCLDDPQKITAIHAAYKKAGSRIGYSDTFGALPGKLGGLDQKSVITAAIKCVRDSGMECVAFDIGPSGEMSGITADFDQLYDMYKQAFVYAQEAGADLIICETFSDLCELRAAVLAAKENTSLPIAATMSFAQDGRTFTGCSAACFARTIAGLGADAIGVNCSLGPKALMPVLSEIAENCALPLIIKPNAGLPRPDGGYDLTPEEFAKEIEVFVALGCKLFGGCCGTTPEYIARVSAMLGDKKPAARTYRPKTAVCSASRMAAADGVLVTGERINPTGKKRFAQALRDGDMDYILRQAIDQMNAGADLLDVNVGTPGVDEPVMMKRVVTAVQSVCDLPLQIDSTDPVVIEAGLRMANGVCIVNSVNGEQASMDAVLPLVKKYGANVVALTLDEQGIPKTAEKRIEIALKIAAEAEKYGIGRERLIIDCLTLTVSAEQSQAMETLSALREVKRLGFKTTLGVSNISFGLPARPELNRAFLTMALTSGLDFAIINPNVREMISAVAAFRALSGQDANCAGYIALQEKLAKEAPVVTAAAAPQTAAQAAPEEPAASPLAQAVEQGLSEAAGREAKMMLEQGSEPLALIEGSLIPALDRVGARYEKGVIFLPQLLQSAAAAQAAFEEVKTALANSGAEQVSRGGVIVATVKGDIHDIGKNIAKVILQNYGYDVTDLGRDVPPERIYDEAVRTGAKLIGLSALMTTTLPAMKKTIELLKPLGRTVYVAGAVVTPEYAKEIGADAYAKDARESVQIAREVFGG